VLLTTRYSFVAALEPNDTWSSCPCEESIVSTEAGVQSCLDWLTTDAAQYCGIMKPEFTPGFATRNDGGFSVSQLGLWIWIFARLQELFIRIKYGNHDFEVLQEQFVFGNALSGGFFVS